MRYKLNIQNFANFIPDKPSSPLTQVIINFDNHITKVSVTDANNNTYEWTTSGQTSDYLGFIDATDYTFNVTLNNGYVLDTVTLLENGLQGTFKSKTNNSFTITADGGNIGNITLTSKQATPSTGTIKFGSDSPTKYYFGNKEVDKIYIGNILLYKKESAPTGETWVLNDNLNTAKALEKTEINFTSNNTQYTALQYKRGTLSYYTVDGSLIDIANPLPEPEGTSWVYPACKTITFETAPTGDLLTWLQANGTKQGGTTAHTLTWSDNTIAVTVNGNTATSPYTLSNGDTIVLKRTSKPSYNAIITAGTDTYDTDVTSSPIAINNSDILIEIGTTSPSPSLYDGFTINYTYNADSGGSSVSKNWKFNGTSASVPQKTYSKYVDMPG